MRLRLAAFLALCLGAQAVSAQDVASLRSLITAGDSQGWEGVGRIELGGAGFCTGALIEPDVVLTAAHCLFDPETGARVPDHEIEFLAGWRNGRAAAYRAVRRSVLHPDYAYTGPQGGDHVAHDVALLALTQPIRMNSVTPFPIGARPRKGDAVGVVSYAHDRANRPALQEVCHVLGRPAGALVMSCDVDFGSSGAPVFVIDEAGPQIVSVVSAKAEVRGRPVSVGTGLEDSLFAMRQALGADRAEQTAHGTRIRRHTVETRPTSGGAKFVRP